MLQLNTLAGMVSFKASAVNVGSVMACGVRTTSRPSLPGSAADEIGYVLDAHLAMLANSRLVRGVHQRVARRSGLGCA